jgi:osmotically-inducible protein OsmY
MQRTTTPLGTAVPRQSAPAQSVGQAIGDGVLTAKLRARLAADPITCAYTIQVDNFNGTMILSGYVEFVRVRVRTLKIAHELIGTLVVKDMLEIRGTGDV